ncbi:hypothetical protein [Spiroplasma endosymbiont of Amphibalanus improvisus]|uniref:hypothetical protein n=1 Tax=Spiroplasma endosymbiont of Amphibalanus improvisus TaxID=3066327 RepID=UPI00313E9B26
MENGMNKRQSSFNNINKKGNNFSENRPAPIINSGSFSNPVAITGVKYNNQLKPLNPSYNFNPINNINNVPVNKKPHDNKKTNKNRLLMGLIGVIALTTAAVAVTIPISVQVANSREVQNIVEIPQDIFTKSDTVKGNNVFFKGADIETFEQSYEHSVWITLNDYLDSTNGSIVLFEELTFDWTNVNFTNLTEQTYYVNIDCKDPSIQNIPPGEIIFDSTDRINLSVLDISDQINLSPYVTTDSSYFKDQTEQSILNALSAIYPDRPPVTNNDISFSYSSTMDQYDLDLSSSTQGGGRDFKNQILLTTTNNNSLVYGSMVLSVTPTAYSLTSPYLFGSQHKRPTGNNDRYYASLYYNQANYINWEGTNTVDVDKVYQTEESDLEYCFRQFAKQPETLNIPLPVGGAYSLFDFTDLYKFTSNPRSWGYRPITYDADWTTMYTLSAAKGNGVVYGSFTRSLYWYF